MSRFLKFVKHFDGNIEVVNKKGDSLGLLQFNKKWKKWCFYPENDTFYDSECLYDIAIHLRVL